MFKRLLPLFVSCLTLNLLAQETTPALRIMPLGDSITFGSSTPGGYRLPLYTALTTAGYRINYVGPNNGNAAPGLGTEVYHAGYGGWRISNPGANNGLYEFIDGWLAQIDDPDIVLIHVGTNDTNDPNFGQAIGELDALITRIATLRPYAHIVVTTLMKRGNNDNDALYTAINTHFNPFVAPLVQTHQNQGHRVHFLDMHAHLERSDMYDNLHPSADGYAKMAAAWYDSVLAIATPYGDYAAPGFSSVHVVDATTLKVYFSKALDLDASSDVTNPAAYTLAEGQIKSVSALSADQRSVTLTLSKAPAYGTSHTLTFSGHLCDVTPTALGGPYGAQITESRTFSIPHPIYSGDATDNLPAELLQDWEPLYKLEIPNGVRYGREPVAYAVDNSPHLIHTPIERVAYYMALQRAEAELYYVWVEIDPFTQDITKLGVPTTASGAFFQEPLTNLKVITTHPNVTPGSFAQANIEFWPCNYDTENSANVPNANGAIFDFGDRASDGDYGSMQIHNTAHGETLFAFNHWGLGKTSGNSFKPCLGIGNRPNPSANNSGPQKDWTFDENADQYVTKTLQVFIKRAQTPQAPMPIPLNVYRGYDNRHIAIEMSGSLMPSSISPGAFTLDHEVAVLKAELAADLQTITLTTSELPEANLTLSMQGLRDLHFGQALPSTQIAITDLPDYIAADVDYLAQGYRVVYVLDIPLYSNFGGTKPAPYLFSAADSAQTFTRVAYHLEATPRQSSSATQRQYAWASMNSFTPYLSQIGIPNYATKVVFAKIVTNLTVKSNKSGLQNGDFATGNIEFWPSNYNESNPNNVPGASGSDFDFGDGNYNHTVGHGCMQVHNYLQKQTIFAINDWSNDNPPRIVSLGIGNCPTDETTNNKDKDWTFAKNSAFYSRRRLTVLALPTRLTDTLPPPEVVARIPAAGDYQHLYTLDIPTTGRVNNEAALRHYYSVNNSAKLQSRPFTRVAYYFELVKGQETNYCWTAFDPFTTELRKLGVPDNYTFWHPINNLDVRSNVPGVANADGITTGNIEFHFRNYDAPNTANIPNASGSLYDFGDNYKNDGDYGCMQVHDYGQQTTFWAFNCFGRDTKQDVGIGSSAGKISGQSSSDWTFAQNSDQYDSRRLMAFIMPVSAPEEIPPEVQARIPHANEYRHLYTIDIPTSANVKDDATYKSYLTVNNAAHFPNGTLKRVAYFMELVQGTQTNYCWTAFDPFTHEIERLGIPRKTTRFQQYINNLEIISNVNGIQETQNCDTGNIEFWDSSYNAANSLNVPHGSATRYDFADNPSSTTAGYGSMQVHNWAAQQTLWAFNNFNNLNDKVCIGIGNNPQSGEPDYTFAQNGAQYDSRRLLVFIQPGGGSEVTITPPRHPRPTRAIGQTNRDGALVFFDHPIAPASVIPDNFTADNDLTITAAELHPAYNQHCVILTTSAQTVNTTYTLTVSNIGSRHSTLGVLTNQVVSFQAQREIDVRPDLLAQIDEAGAYKIIQKLEVTRPNAFAQGAPYALDDSWPPVAMPFDRVAYLLDLHETGGTRKWVWVSMDPFTTDILRLGLPTSDRAARFQQYVYNLNINASPNVTTITPGTFADGNIEFWPDSYTAANAANIPGANGGKYDFGDSCTGDINGYGSFQVHNYRLKQTLFAINCWGTDNRNVELGIGNSPQSDGNTDYTFSDAYNQYTARTLYVLVRPSATALVEVAPAPGLGTTPLITRSPHAQSVQLKETASFEVVALNAQRYQWRKNGVLIPGATAPSLTLPAVRTADAGLYDVLVYGNGSNFSASTPAQLFIIPQGTMLIIQ